MTNPAIVAPHKLKVPESKCSDNPTASIDFFTGLSVSAFMYKPSRIYAGKSMKAVVRMQPKIKRHNGTPCLETPKKALQGLRVVILEKRNVVTAGEPQLLQGIRQPIGSGIELRIRYLPGSIYDGHIIRKRDGGFGK